MDFMAPTSALPLLLLYAPLFTLVSCLAIHYLVYSRRVAQWRRSNIPFLRPSFLIGHKYFLNLTKYSSLVSIDRIYNENSDKDVVGFFMATMPMVLVRKPWLIKQIFVKNFDKTFEPGLAGSRNDHIAQNMLNLCADKSLWLSSRKALSPMFSTSRMSGEAFVTIAKQIDRLWAHAEEARLGGRPINVKEVSQNFLNDATEYNLFGLDANSYEKQGKLLQMHLNITKPSVTRMLSVYAQTHCPSAQVFESLRLINKKLTNSMKSLISQQIENKNQHPSKTNNFVDFLMDLKDDGKQGSGTDITSQMIGFGLATALGGINGPTNLAPFAIHLLSLHPEHQEKIRLEVIQVMQKHKTSEFTYEVVQDLHFTNQCLRETVRLFPSAPTMMRICTEEFKVPGTDYTFKKGESIMVDPYSVHRDPEYFENPDSFEPERFNPENIEATSSDSFLGFGMGPRKCPGFRIGLLVVATLIGSLVHKYEIKPRSHIKQMDATDFCPLSFSNIPRDNILVDLVPHEITV